MIYDATGEIISTGSRRAPPRTMRVNATRSKQMENISLQWFAQQGSLDP